MRQISISLYAEGIVDYRFLPNVILRELEFSLNILDEEYDTFPCIHPLRNPRGDFLERMLYMESTYVDQDIIFVHQDADSRNRSNVLTTRWEPWCHRAEDPIKWVPVIPVQIIEAWMLADKNAICAVLQISEADYDDSFDRRRLENIADPKMVLRNLPGRSQVSDVSLLHELLSIRVSREKLLDLPAYRELASACNSAVASIFRR